MICKISRSAERLHQTGVPTAEICQIYTNQTDKEKGKYNINIIKQQPICRIWNDLYDFCPAGHSQQSKAQRTDRASVPTINNNNKQRYNNFTP